ncbi:MAG: EF-P lysine aminoacylase GenX [Myxococcales bacterium]|nr:EF-P lysine aminoacylase GenX [Myxococcales bacterium]
MHDDDGRRLKNVVLRARLMRAVRHYFDDQGFVEVETPLAVPSPGLDTHLDAFELGGARAPRWLITSPEYQMKRLLAGGLTRIYQTCRCFRRDEAGALHQPEFSMLEWYRGGAGADDVMADTEALVAHAAWALRGGGDEALRVPGRTQVIDLSPPWPRLTVAEAFRRYADADADALARTDETRFFDVYTAEVEPQLGRDKPVFLTHWPASMASLARLVPADPAHAERFEAIVDGVELCNGFGELIDAAEQERRLRRDQDARRDAGLPVYPIDERFLDALREGLPPSGGNALGLDRLLMLLTGATHIDDVCAIPHDRL